MKALLAVPCFVVLLAVAPVVRAEACRPPAPGSWSDARVVALDDSGQERLAAARNLEGDQQRAAAAQAEVMFREIEQRVPCLPTTVVGLAQALELQGKYLEAADQYRRLLDAKSELERYRFYAASLAEAERALPLALNHTARVTLHLHARDCAVGTPRAFLNDAATSFDSGVRVNLGAHTARVEALGCAAFSRTFKVNVAGESPVVIDLSPLPPPHSDPKRVTWLGLPPWVVISGGAVLAVGAGIASYALLSPSHTATPSYTCSSQATLGCVGL
ncbi:MAG TPA: hypothetical protein VER96_36080 [Polyangiaceae bacterium]|nr:hypothetical protein [Polyangiaceae bacterium]